MVKSKGSKELDVNVTSDTKKVNKKNIRLIKTIIVVVLVILTVLLAKFVSERTNQHTHVGNLSDPYDMSFTIEDLKKQGKPVLIDFTAEWCIPCKTFNPILQGLNEEYGEDVIIKIVDVDKYTGFSSKYPLKVIPTQIYINADGTPYQLDPTLGLTGFSEFEDSTSGEVITLHEGALTKNQVKAIIKGMQ